MKRILILLIGIISFTSCEEVIDLELPETEPKLVIEASFNKTYQEASCSNCHVKLTLSKAFYIEEIVPVTDAEVSIKDLTIGFDYTFMHTDEGYYTAALGFIPDFDHEYQLTIIYKNETYQSTIEQLTPVVPIDFLEQGDGTLFEGNEKEVIIGYTDIGDRNDFYFFDFGAEEYLTSKDEFYQGNSFSFSYFYENDVEGEEIDISIFGVSERYYNYLNVLLEQTENDGNPFNTAPANAKGNIVNLTNKDNQPLGYFNLSEFDAKSILIE